MFWINRSIIYHTYKDVCVCFDIPYFPHKNPMTEHFGVEIYTDAYDIYTVVVCYKNTVILM